MKIYLCQKSTCQNIQTRFKQSGRMVRNEQGIALLLTMFVMIFLTVIVIEGFTTAYVDLSIAGNFRDGTKATYIARAGIDAARGMLIEDSKGATSKNYDSLDEPWAVMKDNPFPFPVGDGGVRIEIYDEGGKINLNNLVKCPSSRGGCTDWIKNEEWVEILRSLFTGIDVDPNITDSLVDWLDTNETIEDYGAEQGYYLSLDPPYKPKNGRFLTIRELLLVKDVDQKVFEKIRPYVTVYGAPTGKNAKPYGGININTAPAEVLSALDAEMTEEISESVVEYRKKTPFRNIEKLQEPTGIRSPFDFGNQIVVKSSYFTILSIGSVNEVTKIEKVVVKRDRNNVNIEYWWPE